MGYRLRDRRGLIKSDSVLRARIGPEIIDHNIGDVNGTYGSAYPPFDIHIGCGRKLNDSGHAKPAEFPNEIAFERRVTLSNAKEGLIAALASLNRGKLREAENLSIQNVWDNKTDEGFSTRLRLT